MACVDKGNPTGGILKTVKRNICSNKNVSLLCDGLFKKLASTATAYGDTRHLLLHRACTPEGSCFQSLSRGAQKRRQWNGAGEFTYGSHAKVRMHVLERTNIVCHFFIGMFCAHGGDHLFESMPFNNHLQPCFVDAFQ
jgi:hypothetical protein